MTKRNLLVLGVLIFITGCGANTKAVRTSRLSPEFFAKNKRIAVQEITLSEGLTNAKVSPTDKALLRSIIESKLVQNPNFETISRKNQNLLVEEMGYKIAAAGTIPQPAVSVSVPATAQAEAVPAIAQDVPVAPPLAAQAPVQVQMQAAALVQAASPVPNIDTATLQQKINQKLSVDAFVHGVIYEFEQRDNQYTITISIQIVDTDSGRLWQSEILNITSMGNKFSVFEKVGANVADMLSNSGGPAAL